MWRWAVAVVTAAADGVVHGATVGSLTSVSLHPPVVAFTLRPPSRLLRLLHAHPHVAAHVLPADGAALARHFAAATRPAGAAAFPPLSHYIDADGLPILFDALTVLRATVTATHHVGDHHLCLAHVARVDVGPAAPPLVYHARTYGTVSPLPPSDPNMGTHIDAQQRVRQMVHRLHLRTAWEEVRAHTDVADALAQTRARVEAFYARNPALTDGGPISLTELGFLVHMTAAAVRRWAEEADFDQWLRHVDELAHPDLVRAYYSPALMASAHAHTA